MKYYSTSSNNGFCSDVEEPLDTITTKDRHVLVSIEKEKVQFITQHIHKCLNASSLNEPLKTVLTEDMKVIVTAEFNPDLVKKQVVVQNYSGSDQASDIDNPLPTITTTNCHSLISMDLRDETEQFMVQHFTGNHASSIDNPLPTITTVDHNALVTVKKQDKKQFIDKYLSGILNVQSVDEPMSTITTQPSKALLTVEFIDWILKDVSMRFLTYKELGLCQGFPEHYKFTGTDTKNKQFIGNSVSPHVAKALILANYLGYHKQFINKEVLFG